YVEINASMKKALVIMKMRGSDHDTRLREYEITARGVRVAAPFSGYEGIITGTPHRSLTQEVAGAWDDAFTWTKHKQSPLRECLERRHSAKSSPYALCKESEFV